MTSHRSRAGATRGRRIHAMAPLALLLTLLALLAPAALAAPARPAASGNPVIVWDQSMIYAGQNSGNPWGPVGEHARVQGQHFPDGQYKLALAKGDVNNDPTGLAVCGPTNLIDLSVAVTVSGGSQVFDATFDWPAAANQVRATYSICALKASDSSLASHLDSGPFTVLAANPPQIQLSAAALAPGAKLTVTGKNFVPPQSVLVYAAPCQSCGAPKTAQATVTSADLNGGTFTATLTIPSGTTPGSFYVGAISQNGVLSVPEQTLTVATPSPTATTAPSPTATSAPTATPSQAAGGATGGNTNNNADSGPLIAALLIAALVLLAILAGLVAYLIARGRTPPAIPYRPGEPVPAGRTSGAYPAAYGAAPPPLPMPDEMPTQARSWDPGATRAVPQQPGAAPDPADYDAPTDPGLRSARDPKR